MVRAKTGAAVPPAGPLFLLLSVFIAIVSFGEFNVVHEIIRVSSRSDLHKIG
jgi:hypothetical protein